MKTGLSAKQQVVELIQAEGLMIAYRAAIAICNDPKAPAPARATMATAIFRAGGVFGPTDDLRDKEPHELTADELAARIRHLTEERHVGGNNDEQGIFD